MRCHDCKSARRWARSCGCSWLLSLTRQCWSHYSALQGFLHIAGRVAMVLVAVAVGALCLIGFVNKIAWELRGLVCP